MDVKKFDDGDEPYLDWIEAHPEGYVLNTERGESATYACFHHPDCHFISSEEVRQGPNGFTKHKRIKVCADESAALVDWLINNRPKAVANKKSCGVCRPEIEEVSLTLSPDKQDGPQAQEEGGRQTVTVNRYKRWSGARKACLEHYGTQCRVCGLRFEERYGEIGKGWAGIHVHHEEPLSTGGQTKTDPIEDLKP